MWLYFLLLLVAVEQLDNMLTSHGYFFAYRAILATPKDLAHLEILPML